MFNSANSLQRSNENRTFTSSIMPANLSTSFHLLSKNNPTVNNNASSRALQQYHQSPFAIQQLLGLASSRANSPHKEIKAASPADSVRSSNTETSSTSNDVIEHKLSPNGEHSRASSSISVASHGTISPVSSPKLLSPSTGTTSLSVSNLVNPSVSTNFTTSVAAYFPSRNSPLSQQILHHSASNCFTDDGSPPNGSRISYFNSPAAAAFMSAASMHVGLQQVNSTMNSISKTHGFAGNTVNNAISSMFHPFASDVGKFSEKNSTPGKSYNWSTLNSKSQIV